MLLTMGGCTSRNASEAPTTPDKLRSIAIDRQIAEDERNSKKECKILVLGSGNSGKSTIVQQMKAIHGYTPDELLSYRSVVNRNVVGSAQALVFAMRKFGLDCQHSVNRVCSALSHSAACPTAHLAWRSLLLSYDSERSSLTPRHSTGPRINNQRLSAICRPGAHFAKRTCRSHHKLMERPRHTPHPRTRQRVLPHGLCFLLLLPTRTDM